MTPHRHPVIKLAFSHCGVGKRCEIETGGPKRSSSGSFILFFFTNFLSLDFFAVRSEFSLLRFPHWVCVFLLLRTGPSLGSALLPFTAHLPVCLFRFPLGRTTIASPHLVAVM